MKSKKDIYKLFDLISGKYELTNHVLSGFMDFGWRKKLASMLPSEGYISILDLCCGSGCQTIEILKRNKDSQCIGIDLSEKLLNLANKKITVLKFNHRVNFEKCDAVNLPFHDNSFDFTTVSFGIRNATFKGEVQQNKI